MVDQEIHAMSKVASILEPLDEAARARILAWLGSKYRGSSEPLSQEAPGRSAPSVGDFSDFAQFFEACGPVSDEERVLVSSYWLQEHEGEDRFFSVKVNRALRHMGYAVDDITRTFMGLIEQHPQLVIQLKKTGNTRQARKRYSVTAEGKKVVEMKLRDSDG